MYGVGWGKRWRLCQNLTYHHFKRAAYGLIDYYLEEEKQLRLIAQRSKMDDVVLETKLDAMWGKVTLYNTYQLFVQLTSKKQKNPLTEFNKKFKDGGFDFVSDAEFEAIKADAIKRGALWDDKPEADLLTLYFNATDKLPKNGMRDLVGNANNALKSMAGAEKMLASCDRKAA